MKIKSCPVCGNELNSNKKLCPVCSANCWQQSFQKNNIQDTDNISSKNIPMNYHNIYMILLLIILIIIINNIIDTKKFNLESLSFIVLIGTMLIGLFKRKKFGRNLVMLYNIFLIVGCCWCILSMLIIQDFFSSKALILIAISGGLHIVFFIMNMLIIVWGLCTLLYYKQRKIMFK